MTGTPDPEADPPVRAGYDRWAAVYDHDANPLPALEEPLVRAAAGAVGAPLARHPFRRRRPMDLFLAYAYQDADYAGGLGDTLAGRGLVVSAPMAL